MELGGRTSASCHNEEIGRICLLLEHFGGLCQSAHGLLFWNTALALRSASFSRRHWPCADLFDLVPP
jgi:hypothetical protein